MSRRAAVVVLADGARAEDLEALLAAGELPNVQRHIVDRGSYRRATSVFTSTTGPAHVPIISGQFPGTANLPGYRWFDRARYRPALPAGPWCLRSYNALEGLMQPRDLSPDITTLFEACTDSVNLLGVLSRGADHNVFARRKTVVWPYSHFAHDYEVCDRLVLRAIPAGVRRMGEFLLCVLPGVDWNAHYHGVGSAPMLAAFRAVDAAVGRIADELRRAGRYEDTLLCLCSDHGHAAVEHHFDLAPALDALGLRTAYHLYPTLRRDVDAVVCVSGNAMAMVYLPDPERGWAVNCDHERLPAAVLDLLRGAPAVDVMVTRLGDRLRVECADGSVGLLRDGVVWEPVAGDPFGLGAERLELDPDAALARTAGGEYPDVLVQIAQLFRSSRVGDIVLSAAPGHDFRERYERPPHLSGHGGLHRAHMTVPVAMSAPLADGPLRTADVAATALQWLGRGVDGELDGVSRLALGAPAPA